MKNNLVNESSTTGKGAFPLDYTNHAEKADTPMTNGGITGRVKMSMHSKFDFVDDSAVSISECGRRVLYIRSICRNGKPDSSDQKVN
jgi:hypothetical protein